MKDIRKWWDFRVAPKFIPAFPEDEACMLTETLFLLKGNYRNSDLPEEEACMLTA
jgi:hypothetical protein